MKNPTHTRPKPRVRPIPGTMNKTEEAYGQRLELLKRAGEIRDYKFEGIKLRLAARTFYTPDFVVVTDDQIEMHEVKGFWEDDARVKIKVAAEIHPWFVFVAVKKVKDGWDREQF